MLSIMKKKVLGNIVSFFFNKQSLILLDINNSNNYLVFVKF